MIKRETHLKGLLGAVAIVCIASCLLKNTFSSWFSSAFAFPFEQIGMGLRTLSLSGQAGNIVAVVLYIIISLLPAALFLYQKRKGRLYREEGLLLLLSLLLFVCLYYMVNPDLFLGMMENRVTKAILGSVLYSVLIGYGILKLLRGVTGADASKLQKGMKAFLRLLAVFFVFVIFGLLFSNLMDHITALKGNGQIAYSGMPADAFGSLSPFGQMGETNQSLSFIIILAQYIVEALPYGFNVLVVFAGLELLSNLEEDIYAAETVEAVDKLIGLCKKALIWTVLSNIGLNVAQLALASQISFLNTTVQLPLYAILFLLAALLLARYFKANKLLKEEIDQFI